MNWIHHQLEENRRFYRMHIAKGFYICLFVFLAICAGCYFTLRAMPEQAQKIFDAFSELLKQKGLVDSNGGITASSILENNAGSAAASMALGLLPFAFLPLISLLTNSLVIGGVLAVMAAKGVSAWRLVVFGLLPHGIFEIPAIILGISAGLWLCLNMCRLALRRPSAMPLEEALPSLLRLYLLIVLPLLIVAAAIEGYITPRLLAMFLSSGGTMV